MRKSHEFMRAGGLLSVCLAAAVWAIPLRAADPSSVGPVLWQPSMNVFRRYEANADSMYAFYRDVLGFEGLQSFDVGGSSPILRIEAGATELKFQGRVNDRSYVSGGIDAGTGLRLWTFFFSDESSLKERFEQHGLPVPNFDIERENGSKTAIVTDPDGQLVELVLTGDAAGTRYDEVEIGLVVADLERSIEFYRDFVGLEPAGSSYDQRFETTRVSFKHGATVISLMSFDGERPADTGSGGIQYVVSNVDLVDRLAKERNISIDQPLGELAGFTLRTIWLDDPDGITNYFAETAQARESVER